MSSNLQYRREIDGLRAVAVLPVLFFHARIGFPGGYVGVDVFFVISGYLITSLILKDIESGNFCLLDFWERRIRRILPALFVVVTATLVASWFLFLPLDFKRVGASAAAQSIMAQNVYYWKDSGYFSVAAERKPLLHTWSLAVEEQFYLFLPLLLFCLARWKVTSLIWTVSVLSIASFALSVYGSYYHTSATFYLLPTRAWELFLGTLLAAVPRRRPGIRWLDEVLSRGGLVAILIAAVFYDAQTRFPGTAALLPCLGTAAFIWSNAPRLTTAGYLLCFRVIVGIGLISYSLYLWHWPALVFSQYWLFDELPLMHRILLLLLSFVLAILTWKYVETPFRKRQLLADRPRLFALTGLALVALCAVGLTITALDGVRARFSPEALQYAEGERDTEPIVEVTCRSALKGDFPALPSSNNSPTIDCLVWGDSHAMVVLPVVNVLCREYSAKAVAATHSSTAPLVGFTSNGRYALNEESITFNNAVIQFVRDRRIKNVLLVANWSGYGFREQQGRNGDSEAAPFHHYLELTIQALQESGSLVWIMKRVPGGRGDVPKLLTRAAIFGTDKDKIGMSLAEHRKRCQYEDEIFRKVIRPGVVVLDPADYLVDQAGFCPVERDGRALYCDCHHLTVFGAMQLRPLFEPIFQKNRAK